MRTALCIVFVCAYFTNYSQEVRIHLEKCTLDKETLAEIKSSLQFQVDFYARIFNDHTVNSFKARIFGTKKEFLKYSKDKANFNPVRTNSIAFYDDDLKEMILHKEIDHFSQTFSHELSHAILHYYCKDASSWLHEGLSEFFEDIIFKDSAYHFDLEQVNKINAARSFLLEGASIDEAIYSRDFYRVPSTKNYTLSWAIIFYLYTTKADLLSKTVRESCNERDVFDLIYPGGLKLLQIDVKSFFLNEKPSLN
jgi:hypothetical protein